MWTAPSAVWHLDLAALGLLAGAAGALVGRRPAPPAATSAVVVGLVVAFAHGLAPWWLVVALALAAVVHEGRAGTITLAAAVVAVVGASDPAGVVAGATLLVLGATLTAATASPRTTQPAPRSVAMLVAAV